MRRSPLLAVTIMSRCAATCILLLLVAFPLRAQANPGTSLAIGLGGTLAPAITGIALWTTDGADPSTPALIVASGIVLGPAIGHWSAGLTGKGFKGFGLRTGIVVLSFAPAFGICGWDCSVADSKYDVAWAVIATGAGIGLFSAVHDLSSMKSDIRSHRDRRGHIDPQIVPGLDPATRSVGVRAQLFF